MGKNAVYDVVVVGAGATGLWTAARLGAQGLSVALVEAGTHVQPVDGEHLDELLLSSSDYPYTHPPRKPFRWLRVRGIGGRMNAWGRVALRMSPLDFAAGGRDGFGDPWPISYRDLAPHYARVERALRVVGLADGLPQLPDGVFLRARENAVQGAFRRTIEKQWPERHPIVARLATRNVHELLRPVLRGRRLRLLPRTVATRILLDPSGDRAVGVATLRDPSRRERDILGKRVVLCGSTIETTRLLLESQSDAHPNGIGNRRGSLGRYLMDHTMIDLPGIIPFSRALRAPLERASMSYLPRFQNLGRRSAGFLRGFGVVCSWLPCPAPSAAPGACPYRGAGAAAHAGHFNFRSFGEVLPRRSNRVTLGGLKDALGMTAVDIDFGYGANERVMIQAQCETLISLANQAGLLAAGKPKVWPPGFSFHELGTARMGTDPSRSVLAPDNSVWGVQNLYVVDGACFTSGGSQNPTLTMLAIAERACVALLGQRGGGAGHAA